MSPNTQLIALLGIPALLGFPVWVARYMLTRMERHLAEHTRLLTILVERSGGDTRRQTAADERAA